MNNSRRKVIHAISDIDDAEDYVSDVSNNLMYAISYLEDAMN